MKLTEKMEADILQMKDSFYPAEELLAGVAADDPEALFNLSSLLQSEFYEEDKDGLWLEVLKKSSDLGCEYAQEQLADLYNLDSVPHEEGADYVLYEKLAAKSNLRGLYRMGMRLLDPDNPDRDPALGTAYFEEIGSREPVLAEPVAKNFMYLRDYERAIKYFRLARICGEPESYPLEYKVDREQIQCCYYGLLSWCYYAKEDYANAGKYAEKGIRTLADPTAYGVKGLLALKENNFRKALVNLKKADGEEKGLANLGYGLLYGNPAYSGYDREKALRALQEAANAGLDCAAAMEALKADGEN